MTDLTQIIADWRENGTPGPWERILLDTDGRMFDRPSARPLRKGYFGRAVQSEFPSAGEKPVVALVPHCDADHDADATLVAAAPDMADEIQRLQAENARLKMRVENLEMGRDGLQSAISELLSFKGDVEAVKPRMAGLIKALWAAEHALRGSHD